MKKLGTILEEAGVIDEIQLVRALSHQRKWRCRLGKSLVELGFVTEETIAKTLGQQLGIPFREFDPRQTPAELLELIPKNIALEKHIFPLTYVPSQAGKTVMVAMSDPMDKEMILELERITNVHITPAIVKDSAIEEAINGWDRFQEENQRSRPEDFLASAHSESIQEAISSIGDSFESADVVEEDWPEEVADKEPAPVTIPEIPSIPEPPPVIKPAIEPTPDPLPQDLYMDGFKSSKVIDQADHKEAEELLSVSSLPPIDHEEELDNEEEAPSEIPEIEHSQAWEQVMPEASAGVEIPVEPEISDESEVVRSEPWEHIMPGVDAAKSNEEKPETPVEEIKPEEIEDIPPPVPTVEDILSDPEKFSPPPAVPPPLTPPVDPWQASILEAKRTEPTQKEKLTEVKTTAINLTIKALSEEVKDLKSQVSLLRKEVSLLKDALAKQRRGI